MADCFIVRRGSDTMPDNNVFNNLGIVGYFDMSTLDINNNVWINKLDDTNNIVLPSGGAIMDNALYLTESQRGEFLASQEPYTFYCIFKTMNEVSNFTPIVTKRRTNISNYYD